MLLHVLRVYPHTIWIPSKAVAFFDIDGTLVWRDFEALASGGSAEGVVGSFGAAPYACSIRCLSSYDSTRTRFLYLYWSSPFV